MKKFALIFPFLLLVTACSSVSNTPLADDANIPVDYVGMTVEQATQKATVDGVPFRVVMENGTALPATMDYRPGRINATVENSIVVGYDVEGAENEAVTVYDQNSWRTMIPDSCASFFDGCNNCRRMEGEAEVACTRMYCETYRKPECRDGEEADEGMADPKAGNDPPVGNTLSEAQARTIAEASCIKGGEALATGFYNSGTKTWWFDANLNSVRAGCNPACVVSEETKTAEINWRCTGLVPLAEPQ